MDSLAAAPLPRAPSTPSAPSSSIRRQPPASAAAASTAGTVVKPHPAPTLSTRHATGSPNFSWWRSLISMESRWLATQRWPRSGVWPGLDGQPGIQGRTRTWASGWVEATATHRFRSVSVSTIWAGSSLSGARKGGDDPRTARSRLPARNARTRTGVPPSRVMTLIPGCVRRSRVRALGQWDGARAGEHAEPHDSGLGRHAVQFTVRGVDRVEHGCRVAEDHPPPGRDLHPLSSTFEHWAAGGALDDRDLPGHSGLDVAQRRCGGGETAALGDLAYHPEPDQRHIRECHDHYACHG